MDDRMFEITRLMNDSNVLKGDISQAADIVKSHFANKYINPLATAIENENKNSRKHPSKEAKLLEAMRPFIPHYHHDRLNQAIDSICMMDTIKKLSSSMPKPTISAMEVGIPQSSIHDDGIYNIDEKCLRNKHKPTIAPILLVLMLMQRA